MIQTALLALSSLIAADEGIPPRVKEAFGAASVAEARAHVRFLSHDLLEGRAPGTRGGDLAALYLATELEALGMLPGAANGTFFQEVPLLGVKADQERSRVVLRAGGADIELKPRVDFSGTDLSQREESRIDAAELVFVGYGIDADEQDWDDYKGRDLSGKVLLVLVNDPPSDDPSRFGGRALTYYGRWTYKLEEAARRGAAGALLIHRDDLAGYGWAVVENSYIRERPFVDERDRDAHRLSLAGWIPYARIREILSAQGHDLDRWIERAATREFEPIDTGITVSAHMFSKLRPLVTHNVLGLLRGTTRAHEVVVYTAHYDHLGVDESAKGDRIFNGAVDNAGGCAAVLEVARMFRRLDPPPSRSILFLFVTAEEGGLRGSHYFATHPTFAPARIAANLNLDGIAVHGTPIQYEPLGYDKSTLRGFLDRAAGHFGIELVPDTSPEQGLFYRSDHFSFAKVGVPAINLKTGVVFSDQPEGWGRAQVEDYRKNRYHRPTDEFDPSWDMRGIVQTSRFAFAIGALVAEADELPRYVDGDEFAGLHER